MMFVFRFSAGWRVIGIRRKGKLKIISEEKK